MGIGAVTTAILARAKRDEKFRNELIESLQKRQKESTDKALAIAKTIRVVKKLNK